MIPVQLQDARFRFIRTNPLSKAPVDAAWNKEGGAHFGWNSPEITAWSKNAQSYGVRTGVGGLVVVDFDDEATEQTLLPLLPQTFTVKSAGKGRAHAYFLCRDAGGTLRYKNREGRSLLDLQVVGAQVVGPGSLNRATGRRYEVARDLPIAETTFANIKETIARAGLTPANEEKTAFGTPRIYNGPNAVFYRAVNERIKVGDLLAKAGVTVTNGKARCPFHADDKPSLSVDNTKNLAYCFACGQGWNVVTLHRKLREEGRL